MTTITLEQIAELRRLLIKDSAMFLSISEQARIRELIPGLLDALEAAEKEREKYRCESIMLRGELEQSQSQCRGCQFQRERDAYKRGKEDAYTDMIPVEDERDQLRADLAQAQAMLAKRTVEYLALQAKYLPEYQALERERDQLRGEIHRLTQNLDTFAGDNQRLRGEVARLTAELEAADQRGNDRQMWRDIREEGPCTVD